MIKINLLKVVPFGVFLKNVIKILLNYFNLRVKKDYFNKLCHSIYQDVDLILDIGANIGQFAKSARSKGYKGLIVSIEPSSKAHSILLKNAEKDPLWKVYERIAVGEHQGKHKLNLASNSVSSSLLPMNELHLKAAPKSSYFSQETVEVKSLDTILSDFTINLNCLLKIDTQGFEMEVLTGAENALKFIKYIMIELSVFELYKGQANYFDITKFLIDREFKLISIDKSFEDPNSGKTLQYDAIFERN